MIAVKFNDQCLFRILFNCPASTVYFLKQDFSGMRRLLVGVPCITHLLMTFYDMLHAWVDGVCLVATRTHYTGWGGTGTNISDPESRSEAEPLNSRVSKLVF